MLTVEDSANSALLCYAIRGIGKEQEKKRGNSVLNVNIFVKCSHYNKKNRKSEVIIIMIYFQFGLFFFV